MGKKKKREEGRKEGGASGLTRLDGVGPGKLEAHLPTKSEVCYVTHWGSILDFPWLFLSWKQKQGRSLWSWSRS